MLSYSTGPLLGNMRAGLAARWLGVGGSVVSGGVLCVIGTVALAAALPRFLRYDGRHGLTRKQAEDEAWATAAATRAASVSSGSVGSLEGSASSPAALT
jgi:hypothetical protein